MTQNEYKQILALFQAAARLHLAATSMHLPGDCPICQFLDDRRAEVVRRRPA